MRHRRTGADTRLQPERESVPRVLARRPAEQPPQRDRRRQTTSNALRDSAAYRPTDHSPRSMLYLDTARAHSGSHRLDPPRPGQSGSDSLLTSGACNPSPSRDAKVAPEEIDHRRVVSVYRRTVPRALVRLCDVGHLAEFWALRHDRETLRLHEGRQVCELRVVANCNQREVSEKVAIRRILQRAER